jgi:hypothetical protein
VPVRHFSAILAWDALASWPTLRAAGTCFIIEP